MKRLVIILNILLLALPMFAQLSEEERAKIGAGEINRQAEFFDPTRKEQKVKEEYKFSVDYRVEAGYVQNQQRSDNWANPFLHGLKLGFTADFNLPVHFSIQTGLALNLTYGQIEQHWRSMDQQNLQKEYLRHGFNQYYLEVPVRAYYTQKLWKELNMFFFAGPKVEVGLAQLDFVHDHLSDPAREWLQKEGVQTGNHNRYSGYTYTDAAGLEQQVKPELFRTNVQMGLGGGLEWDCYRLVAGYDFGLNNLVRNRVLDSSKMNEWGWYVSFAYRLNKKTK